MKSPALNVTDEQFHDDYLRVLTEALHEKKCNLSHMDQCGWQHSPWASEYEEMWNTRRFWMRQLLEMLEHAEDCGLTIEQFVQYERLEGYTN